MTDQELDWRGLNRSHWDERVPIHLSGEFYDVAGFVRHPDVLRAFEVTEVGDVSGKRLVHLQCHIGLDSLSWAARGASVVGLDFSVPAVEAAQAIAAEVKAGARFVAADVYEAVEALGGETFNVVYTGLGALCWLPDLTRWARVVERLLAPGGFLYLVEFHPFAHTLDDATGRTVAFDYFDEGPHVWTDPGSYADPAAATRKNTTVQYEHRLGSVISAVAGAGLRIDFLHEHDMTLFRQFASLVRGSDGFRLREGLPRVPLMYSLRAAKPCQ
ncbi:class I SAM-dependent methyltransferase [Frankia sp. Mgl5]|uniref:class I SAM-dependent methyltransferase n=1 Tax=Frankia sp. Mgl5 TaxID=2933793 RepID=UPI00200EF6D6|nr:methyltransferase [Frankia sp. Mgl5]MCK9928412.1 class I SAM-dependent methyltransferase [Frankia sp. Mgl5]